VKKKALEDVFRSAADIVDEVMRDEVNPNTPLTSFPAPVNLARQANCKQRAARPNEPTNLDFEISENRIPPNFLQYDIFVGDRRHLLFSVQDQMSLLRNI